MEQIEYEKESLQRVRELASDQDCRKESLLREIENIEQEMEGLQRLHEAEVRKQQEADFKKLNAKLQKKEELSNEREGVLRALEMSTEKLRLAERDKLKETSVVQAEIDKI